MVQPEGFEHPNRNLVCKLHKVLYGLKQVPKAWFEIWPLFTSWVLIQPSVIPLSFSIWF